MTKPQSTLNFLRLANHALRTPLTVVSGCISLLESFSGIDVEQTTELISRAATRSKESSRITSDMMIITENLLKSKNQTVRESDLKLIFLEAFDGFDVDLTYPDNVELSVLVNEIDFVSALRRIVSSSARWGKVKVDTDVIEREARIRISDAGPPIEQSHDQLFVEFEPFAGRGEGIHSLSHVYSYILLQTNDAFITYGNVEDLPSAEVRIPLL